MPFFKCLMYAAVILDSENAKRVAGACHLEFGLWYGIFQKNQWNDCYQALQG